MKKLFIICIAILFSLTTNAQYVSFANVNANITDYSKLNEDQLNLAYSKSEKNIKTSQILVGAGIGATIIGAVMYMNSINSIIGSTNYDFSDEMAGSTAGILFMLGGGTMVGIGIPLWIGNSNKINEIEIHLTKFKAPSQKPIAGIGFTFTF